MTKHLYVHIPFCRSRCSYCDFASEPIGRHARAGRVERYMEALRAELAERGGAAAGDIAPLGAVAAPGTIITSGEATMPGAAGVSTCRADTLSGGIFDTVYVGGGTPTVLPPDLLVPLVQDLALWMGPAPATPSRPEFTMEANPGSINALLLERLAEAGVTRLSLGVQSFSPELRATLGRRVTQKQIADAVDAIAHAQWPDWNLDLVFGIPGQNWSDARADLEAAVAAEPTHISLYDLTYTSAFRTRVKASLGAEAQSAAVAFAEQHYAEAVAALETAGYGRYEVSNFALPGYECHHNLVYWRGEDYLGIGASAVSTVGSKRRTNPRQVVEYLDGRRPRTEELSPATRLWERAMLGLRTREGVDESAVLPVLDIAALDRLSAQGCLERRCGKLRLNPGFLDISNAVIGALLVYPGE